MFDNQILILLKKMSILFSKLYDSRSIKHLHEAPRLPITILGMARKDSQVLGNRCRCETV